MLENPWKPTVDDSEVDRKRFVVGLGNPGSRYAPTRHNVGFRVLDVLRRRWNLGPSRKGFSGRTDAAHIQQPNTESRHVLLLEPHTFMNCSGRAVRELMLFYKANFEQVLVVLDDMWLELGRLRMRVSGSHGGHKGLSDIITQLGTEAIPRLRIGIGSPPEPMDGTDFVLSRFGEEELETIEHAIQLGADAVEDWVFNGAKYVMDTYNKKPES